MMFSHKQDASRWRDTLSSTLREVAGLIYDVSARFTDSEKAIFECLTVKLRAPEGRSDKSELLGRFDAWRKSSNVDATLRFDGFCG